MFYHQQLYQRLLVDLDGIGSRLNLTLPTNAIAINQQLTRIGRSQDQLYELEAIVIDHLPCSYQEATWESWRHLLLLIRQAIRYADSLKHLAEEYPLDPEGSVACLRHLNQRNVLWHQHLKQLQIPTPRTTVPPLRLKLASYMGFI